MTSRFLLFRWFKAKSYQKIPAFEEIGIIRTSEVRFKRLSEADFLGKGKVNPFQKMTEKIIGWNQIHHEIKVGRIVQMAIEIAVGIAGRKFDGMIQNRSLIGKKQGQFIPMAEAFYDDLIFLWIDDRSFLFIHESPKGGASDQNILFGIEKKEMTGKEEMQHFTRISDKHDLLIVTRHSRDFEALFENDPEKSSVKRLFPSEAKHLGMTDAHFLREQKQGRRR